MRIALVLVVTAGSSAADSGYSAAGSGCPVVTVGRFVAIAGLPALLVAPVEHPCFNQLAVDQRDWSKIFWSGAKSNMRDSTNAMRRWIRTPPLG